MNISLNKPYKIILHKQKRYNAHYNIPSAQSLVVPLASLGEEVLCDVRWENDNGELELRRKMMFISDNLVPVNQLTDDKLFELWDHYYDQQGNN